MSFLDKLSISGVRSYNSEGSQGVQFYPLTIILGPNGSGKTSIIEALKYVTTGLTPPNSNGGKTFICDPTLANSTTTRGQVKLKFTDIEKKTTVVTRSLESNVRKVKNKTQTSFKQLNAVIKRDNKTIDQRCGDINNEMLTLLGVSKPVLSNVIFCHQEDCNWPLSEGKVLKEKFDDIFGSMGYVKALEKIKKLRKTESEKQKLLEKDVNLCKYLKEESDSKKKSLNESMTKLSTHKEKISEYENTLSKVKSELNEILAKEKSVDGINKRMASIEGKLEEKERMLKETKKTIKTLFKGTEDELNSQINNFEINAQNAKEKKSSLINKLSDISKNCSKMIESQQNMTKEMTKLQVEEDQYKRLINERSLIVANIRNETSLSLNSHIINKIDSNQHLESNDILILMSLLSDGLINLNKELSEGKSARNKNYELLNQELSKLKALRSNYEHEVQLWETDLRNKQSSLADIKLKISNSGKSETQYNTIIEEINRLNNEISEMEKTDIEKIRKDVVQNESNKKSLKSEINILEEKLKKVNEQNEERIKLEILKKDKNEKEMKAKQISEVQKEVMESVGAIEGEFHSSLENHIRTLSTQLDRKSTNVSKIENELTEKGTRVKMNQESIKKNKQELNKLEIKVRKVCQIDEYEKALINTENELKELRSQMADTANYEPFLKKQINCVESTDSCPVCERDMNKEWNATNGHKLNKKEVLQKLQKLIKKTPDSIEELKNKIQMKESHYNSLLSLKTDVQTIKKLTKEIPEIETQITKNIEENNNQRKILEKEKLEINKLKSELNSLRSVLPEASEYDNYYKEIKDLDYKINCVVWKFDSDSESVEDIDNELQLKKVNYEEIDSQLSKSQKIISKHSESYNKLRNDLQNAERNKLEIEKQQHEKIGYDKKKAELEENINALDKNIIDSQMKAMELNPKIDEIESQKTDLSNDLREFEQKVRNKIEIIKEKQKDIERLNRQIDDYKQSGKSNKISELIVKLSEIKDIINKAENDKSLVNDQINQISEEISNFEVRKRELIDNRQVFIYEKEIESQKILLEDERKKLGFHDLEALRKKKRELEKEEKKLEALKQQSLGMQIPILDSINKLEDELKIAKYKNADTIYKQKSIELAISDISGDDLNKYYKALDFAVSAFHKRKMEEINKLIKGFWQKAYRGLDIDFIKITSDEEERSANDKRRTYNYRVVMVKGNVEMDMRGRCSAGQKVLASLVIRLALAEIFSSNCSVLALDEPTTNLDKENVISFANAITQIVKYRNKWTNSNFQLIIITHDEEFLRCLDSETGQYYYKVFKNEFGFSTILRKSINDCVDDNTNE
jgi:DNA repair protein RAD50